MATTADTTLVTLAEFQTWAQDSNRKVDTGTDGVVLESLRVAQSTVEKTLGRRLFCRFDTIDWKPTEWVNVAGTDYRAMYVPDFPVVEVSTGLAIYTKGGRNRRVYATSEPSTREFSLYTGYKRSDQNLAALNAITTPTDLSAMTGTPDDCPDDLAATICEVALFRLDKVGLGSIAMAQTVETTGTVVETNSAYSYNSGEIRALILDQLSGYRVFSMGAL